MDLAGLGQCLASLSCVVTQTTSGLIIGLLLFLVAAGVSLIFGVLKVINFAHGSFYMLGLYAAVSVVGWFGNSPVGFWGGVLLAALFWWNRRRRDRFDREDGPTTAATEQPEPSSGDDDADDLQAAARGPAPKDES